MGIIKVAKAIYRGAGDYSRQTREINTQAEKNLTGSFGDSSTNDDANRVHREMRRLRKERGALSLVQSIRNRYNQQ